MLFFSTFVLGTLVPDFQNESHDGKAPASTSGPERMRRNKRKRKRAGFIYSI
jgi:hypothetical protein